MAKRSTKKSKTTTTKAKPTRDAYGSDPTSQRGVINAALDLRKARTIDELVEATGLSRQRIVTHVRYLVVKEWAKAVGDGYRLLKPKAK